MGKTYKHTLNKRYKLSLHPKDNVERSNDNLLALYPIELSRYYNRRNWDIGEKRKERKEKKAKMHLKKLTDFDIF